MVISVLLGAGFRRLLFVWHFSFSSKKLFSGNTKRLPVRVQLGGAGTELGCVGDTSPAVNPWTFRLLHLFRSHEELYTLVQGRKKGQEEVTQCL